MKKKFFSTRDGIRGLIPSLVLVEIKSRTGRAVAQCFDLIAGTSTGGILAMGLARDDGNGKPRFSAGDLADIYQMKMFSGNRYIRLQTNLAVASDDMDNATNGNIENLKVEAKKLLKTHRGEIETVCELLSG